MHQTETLTRDARLISGEQPPTIVDARTRVHFQTLQALKAVLVKGQDEAEPHDQAGEGPPRGDDRSGVIGRLAEDEQQQRDRKLGKQAGGGNARSPLIGMVVDTHQWIINEFERNRVVILRRFGFGCRSSDAVAHTGPHLGMGGEMTPSERARTVGLYCKVRAKFVQGFEPFPTSARSDNSSIVTAGAAPRWASQPS